ncbi:MAG: CheR family methyltransferase [Sulfuritalea sp.]|nr:CheR family methyltransferase [Sulfuritalea sp.]
MRNLDDDTLPLANDPAPRASGETYFFRDQGQSDLLRLRLLPELIERRRDARTLRLWSAGCASGEEAYSLAMLVDMLLPQRDGWDIFILGSDINPAALAKARAGRYGPWSFRMTPATLQQGYFRRTGDEWELGEHIRRMVRFHTGDLIGEPFPGGELRDMDLILCRNVFIYFNAQAVSTVARKLAAALREGGYLMTGHTELMGHRVPNLQSRLFVEGVVYRRTAPSAPLTAAVSPAAPAAARIARPPAAAQRAPGVPPAATPNADDLLAAARQFADRGEYDNAMQACRQALIAAPLAPGPHFLLAQLAQLDGEFERAGELLDKTLYLDSGCVAAYLELAALCERADKLPRAQSLRRAALDIVRALPGDAVVEPYETTAAELAQWLAQSSPALTAPPGKPSVKRPG